jgi:hypothetical protein
MAQVDRTLDLAGASGPVEVRVGGMPVRTDAGGVRYRYPYSDFGADLIEELYRQLPRARRSGPPWRRRDACRDCSVELSDGTTDAEFTMAMRLDAIPPFEVVYRAPAIRCGRCATQQISNDRDLEFHISESLVKAMDAGNVKPG